MVGWKHGAFIWVWSPSAFQPDLTLIKINKIIIIIFYYDINHSQPWAKSSKHIYHSRLLIGRFKDSEHNIYDNFFLYKYF